MSRGRLVAIGVVTLLAAIGLGSLFANRVNRDEGAAVAAEPGSAPEITVYKQPSCGCCGNWAEHMKENGFKVTVKEVEDLHSIKARYGIRPAISSCHTAVVEGYVIEGHVPADLVLRLLEERPDVTGLAVPGMPSGSPGMDGLPQPYDVLTFDSEGNTAVYASR